MTLLEVQRRMANAIFPPLTRSDRMAAGADAEFIKPNNRLTSAGTPRNLQPQLLVPHSGFAL